MAVSTPAGAKASHGMFTSLLEDGAEIHRMERPEEQQNADGESEVADARGDERFLPGADRGLLQEPETDQQVAAQAHAFPADEHQDDVRGEHQREHEKDEQVQVGEEAVVALFVGHVAGRIDVHQQADEGDDEQHHDRELVNLQGEIHFELAGGNPGEIAFSPRGFARRKAARIREPLRRRQRNESATEPMPTELTTGFEKFLPNRPLMAAPSRGSARMIQR